MCRGCKHQRTNLSLACGKVPEKYIFPQISGDEFDALVEALSSVLCRLHGVRESVGSNVIIPSCGTKTAHCEVYGLQQWPVSRVNTQALPA